MTHFSKLVMNEQSSGHASKEVLQVVAPAVVQEGLLYVLWGPFHLSIEGCFARKHDSAAGRMGDKVQMKSELVQGIEHKGVNLGHCQEYTLIQLQEVAIANDIAIIMQFWTIHQGWTGQPNGLTFICTIFI